MIAPKIVGVVLAAGASRRLGRPKQQVVIAGETLLERAVRVGMEAGLAPVVAVVADPTLIEPLQRLGAAVVLNTEADEGMAASVRFGVKAAQSMQADGVVVMTCDQVAMSADHLQALCAEPHSVMASAYAGRKGVPAYFPTSSFAALLSLQGDSGARELLKEATAICDESLALDVDTEEDVSKAEKWLARS